MSMSEVSEPPAQHIWIERSTALADEPLSSFWGGLATRPLAVQGPIASRTTVSLTSHHFCSCIADGDRLAYADIATHYADPDPRRDLAAHAGSLIVV